MTQFICSKRNARRRSAHAPRSAGAAALVILFAAPSPLRAAVTAQPSDQVMTAAVESELWFDSSLPANDIDVTSGDGIVTLSGKVSNLLERNRAGMVAATVKGVRAIVNTITVQPIARSDDEIRKDVTAALLTDPATYSYEIKPSVKGGVVKLTGKVQSWAAKQLATSVAEGVKGVRDVQNDAIVTYTTQRTDSEIAADVTGVLMRDVWVDDLLIHTRVDHGTVILTGTVGSVAEKTRAQSDAWVLGARGVDVAGLKAEPWAKDTMKKPHQTILKSDSQIEDALKDAFSFDPRVIKFNTVIAVKDGVVTLTGTVDNLKAKRAAEQDARNTAGVWRVNNFLRVRGQMLTSDEKLAQSAKEALVRDPYVDRYKISVTALRSVIYLNGTVDSPYEKAHAEDITSRVKGVKDVKNNLLVSHPDYGHYYWPFSESYYEPPFYHLPHAYSTWPYQSDAEVREKIKEDLFWNPFVDSSTIAVAVHHGVATLTGTVDSWNQYYAAREDALAGGAVTVLDDLKVK